MIGLRVVEAGDVVGLVVSIAEGVIVLVVLLRRFIVGRDQDIASGEGLASIVWVDICEVPAFFWVMA